MKKKLLTLVITLVLLIGLVAAMGMNASAASYTVLNNMFAKTENDIIRSVFFDKNADGTVNIGVDVDINHVDSQTLDRYFEGMGCQYYDNENKIHYVSYGLNTNNRKFTFSNLIKNAKAGEKYRIKFYLSDDYYSDYEWPDYNFSFVDVTVPDYDVAVADKLITVSTEQELITAFAEATSGTTIRVGTNLTLDEPVPAPALKNKGTVVLDLNGNHVTFSANATSYLISVGDNTRLHVVNGKYQMNGYMNFNSKYGGASMFRLYGDGAELHLYPNVVLTTGSDSSYVTSGADTSVVKVEEGAELYITGTVIRNHMFNGNAVKFLSYSDDAFTDFKLTIEGGAKLQAKTSCLAYWGHTYPGKSNVRLCDLTYDTTTSGSDSGALKSEFKAITGSDISGFTVSKIIPNNASAVYVNGGGASLTGYATVKDFPKGKEFNVWLGRNCPHDAGRMIKAVYPIYDSFQRENKPNHNEFCILCGEYTAIGSCKAVDEIGATCVKKGATAGYDCGCGYKTTEIIPATGIHTYDNDCDTECNVCKGIRTIAHTYDNACDAECNVCKTTRTPAAHTGGTATCKAKAKCTVCGAEYGSLASHKEVTLAAKSATYTSTGLTAGKKCSVCGTVTVAQQTVAKLTLGKVSVLKAKKVKVAKKSEITLTWTSLGDGVKYEVYVKNGKKWTKLTTTSKTS
ncbi:MAG: hypothetical protein IKA56_02695, partial [Clostridia bacterium]|nr:hypothetical protein [Clostridia bacterium]